MPSSHHAFMLQSYILDKCNPKHNMPRGHLTAQAKASREYKYNISECGHLR